ncbi:MAG: hypothetical protein R2939_10465 [Kofleriaceae bacterium]
MYCTVIEEKKPADTKDKPGPWRGSQPKAKTLPFDAAPAPIDAAGAGSAAEPVAAPPSTRRRSTPRR